MLLLVLSLLAVVRLSPAMPTAAFDDAWPLALDDAAARHLVFGRDVLFTFGPLSAIYTGQYHPRTDRLMVAGGLVVAAALASGLAVVARQGTIFAALLAPLLIASVSVRDPVFMVLPLLLLSVAIGLSQPPDRAAAVPVSRLGVGALVLLTSTDALLSVVKLSFGTEALPLASLAVFALVLRRRIGLAILVVLSYAVSLPGYWTVSGQSLADLPAYIGSVPEILRGYAEGAAYDGPATDIVLYLLAAGLLPALLWRDRSRFAPDGLILLGIGLFATLFVSFKAGFIRHDEHALIALGTLALLPLVLAHALRCSSLACALAVSAVALAVVSHHQVGRAWPSPKATVQQLGAAARGAWLRLDDPGRLPRLFASDLAAYRASVPLPAVSGPTDIYSSGQTVLIANGLDYSPRPALQSFTAWSDAILQADLRHLEGAGGRAPVDNVFFRIEHADRRLPATEDGNSWPALFGEFRVTAFDAPLDTALFQRNRPPAATPIGAIVRSDDGAGIGAVVPLPVSPTGLLWARLDARPTLLGRLVSFLFRPPILSITIDYASGPPEQDRLVPALGRAGFLLGPRVSDTAEMLLLLLPERRTALYRPVSIRLTGAPGTRWLWQRRYRLELRTIALPVQPDLRAAMVVTPQAEPAAADPLGGPAGERCGIDIADDRSMPTGPIAVAGLIRIAGWLVASAVPGGGPDHVLLRFTDPAGRVFGAPAVPRRRPDEAPNGGAGMANRSEFDEIVDMSALHGDYRLTVDTVENGIRRACPMTFGRGRAPAAGPARIAAASDLHLLDETAP